MQRTETLPRAQGRGFSASDAVTWLGNGLAALLAGLAIAAGVIGMLVAFGEIGGSAQPFEDGVMWQLGGVIVALVANVFRREHDIVSWEGAAPVRDAMPRDEARGRDEPRARARRMEGVRDVKDIVGMTVVTTGEAREVGSVDDVLFDPGELAVLALVVTPAGARDARMFVEREHVRGLGRDAVTIDSESHLQGFATKGREHAFTDAGVRLDGVRVTTDRGDNMGSVRRVMLTPDCRIARVDVRSGVVGRTRGIDADDIVSIGQRVIVSRVREA